MRGEFIYPHRASPSDDDVWTHRVEVGAKRMRMDTDHEDGVPLDAWIFVDHCDHLNCGHPNMVLEGLNRLRLNRILCDVILCCEGQEVPCHRSVLASVSPYFEAMFTSGMRESTQERVTISGLEPQAIRLLVKFAYTSRVSISTDNVLALLAASDLFEVTEIREACCEYMMAKINLNNCVDIYCSADDHSCKMLKNHSMDYILDHFNVIYQQEAFLSLSVERLTEVLSSDHLNVPNEDMVFEVAMLWLDKCPTRKQNFEKVLEQIRLPLISPSYLHTVVESLDVVKEQQGCQRFISEAKDRPYCNTARPRRTTAIVMFGDVKMKQYYDKVESFDPLTNQWRNIGMPRYPSDEKGGRLPNDVYGYAVVSSGYTLYLAGGQFYNYEDGDEEGPLSRRMWHYDVHENLWSKMAAMMNEPRFLFSLVMLDGYVYAVGGEGSERSERAEDSVDRYDPDADTWQLMESVGVAAQYENRNSRAVVALDGHLYFIGGAPNEEKPNMHPVAKYNPKTLVWTEVSPMQIPRDGPAACVMNGKIYVTGGGRVDNHPEWTIEKTMECYNPQTNQWTMCAPMQVARHYHGVAVVDGKLHVLGGRDTSGGEDALPPSFVHNVDCYCEETDTWKTVGQMPYVRFNLQCAPLKLRRDHGQPIHDIADGMVE